MSKSRVLTAAAKQNWEMSVTSRFRWRIQEIEPRNEMPAARYKRVTARFRRAGGDTLSSMVIDD